MLVTLTGRIGELGSSMLRVKEFVRQSVQPVHKRFRAGKSELLQKLLKSGPMARLLDVGGGVGIDGEFRTLYERFSTVTWVNISLPHPVPESRIRAVIADGCALPFADRSFDWVFSNAVIEHVGSRRRQELFASEIRRVARTGYFVTTPNLYFPIEPHALLPLYQFYPARLKMWALRFSPGYMRQVEEINLLSRAKLHQLFPEARVISMNFASGLIAYHTTSFSAHS
jgi:hypothetical protein